VRGKTNHFLPFMGDQGKYALFPGEWATKVWASDVGIVGVVAGLCYWAAQTSWAQVRGLTHATPPLLLCRFRIHAVRIRVCKIDAASCAGCMVGTQTQVGCLYFLPYAFVNVWLVLYTWLQHTDTDIPHYADDEWNFVKGALSTVDRPYGPVLNFLHHGIGSTHGAFDRLPYPLSPARPHSSLRAHPRLGRLALGSAGARAVHWVCRSAAWP